MDGAYLAFCPGHISGWFKSTESPNGEKGSVGGGIIISEGVFSEAAMSDEIKVRVCRVDRTGNIISTEYGSRPIEYALSKLGITAEITTKTILPIGAGFGLSAASLLSSIKATSGLYGLSVKDRDIGLLANETEVKFSSGLGDVAACMGGGYICRKSPGINGEIIRKYDMDKTISALSFGPLPTNKVLKNKTVMENISKAFSDECPENPDDFFRIARNFAENSGLISDRIREVFNECDLRNIPVAMTMLGEGVFAYGEKAPGILSRFGEVYMMKMSGTGFAFRNSRE
ncbi:pantoate kinase [Methanomicrobium sp. W14]|uniref:pantoate kinase n=1 Tax=Methanomicrobium sp. W14 TaxID=2817839 RepID=UPI001AE0F520|nr:pantoate kinase [Methanomicrobium sp. W14]MBP2132237.1 pantoate kinase [Methanomicrobium sp. W14]